MTSTSEQFVRLLTPFLADLRRWAAAVARDPGEVDDVVQEAITKAYADFSRFAAGTSFRAFVFTYAAHEVLNRNRAAARRSAREVPMAESRHESAAVAAHEELEHDLVLDDPGLVLERCSDEVRAAFRELRAEDRVIFLLRSVAGLTCREIAESLAAPLGTILGTLYRVRLKLRRRLGRVAAERGLLQRGGERP